MGKIIKGFVGFVQINEAQITDAGIKSQLSRIKQAKDELAELTAELKKIEQELKSFDIQIKPLFDQMKEAQDRIATCEEYTLKIVTFAHERQDVGWKSVVTAALTQVDESAREIIGRCIEANKSTTQVKHSFKIEDNEVNEKASVSAIKSKLKSILSGLTSFIKSKILKIEKATQKIKNLSSKMAVNESHGHGLFQLDRDVEKLNQLTQALSSIPAHQVAEAIEKNPDVEVYINLADRHLAQAADEIRKLIGSFEKTKAFYSDGDL